MVCGLLNVKAACAFKKPSSYAGMCHDSFLVLDSWAVNVQEDICTNEWLHTSPLQQVIWSVEHFQFRSDLRCVIVYVMLLLTPPSCYCSFLLHVTAHSSFMLLLTPLSCYCSLLLHVTAHSSFMLLLTPSCYCSLLLHVTAHSSFMLLLTPPSCYCSLLLHVTAHSSFMLLLTPPSCYCSLLLLYTLYTVFGVYMFLWRVVFNSLLQINKVHIVLC